MRRYGCSFWARGEEETGELHLEDVYGTTTDSPQCGAPRAPATHDSERVAASNVTGRLIVGQNDHGEPFTGQVNRTVADVNGLSEALSTLRLTGKFL